MNHINTRNARATLAQGKSNSHDMLGKIVKARNVAAEISQFNLFLGADL